MKTCKYLQESLNFSDALQQIKQERGVCSPCTTNRKIQSKQNDSLKFSEQNCVGGAKYTKRTNLNLKQLLEQYIKNSENDYVLTLGIGSVQEKKHQVFDLWVSQLSQKQHNQRDILRNNHQNEIKTYSQISQKEKTVNLARKQNKSRNYHSKLINTEAISALQKVVYQKNNKTIEGQSRKEDQQQKQIKIILRPPNQVKDDEVVQQIEDLYQPDEEKFVKQRLIQKFSQELSLNQKQNAGPTYNRQQKEKQIKGLQFSKIKRYKGSKRKRKLQI